MGETRCFIYREEMSSNLNRLIAVHFVPLIYPEVSIMQRITNLLREKFDISIINYNTTRNTTGTTYWWEDQIQLPRPWVLDPSKWGWKRLEKVGKGQE